MLPVRKLLFIAAGSALLIAGIAAAVFLRAPTLQSSARREWKQNRIAEIMARVADPSWPADELTRLNARSTNAPTEDSGWLSERIIVTRKGEWLAYANSCQKQDARIADIFLARGSDGRWYYSTYHFCVEMIVLRMDGQPEDLATFTKTYSLETFDGQSDECLRKTWPPSRR
jgi:hypothetical protein